MLGKTLDQKQKFYEAVKGYTNDLAADIDVGTESIRRQSQSGVPPPQPPPQPDYSFPDNVLKISPRIK